MADPQQSWRRQAPAWHTVGHVWAAASHGCLTGLPPGQSFTVRGPDATLGMVAASCPHTEFSYGGVVGETVGRAWIRAGELDHAGLDWSSWSPDIAAVVDDHGESCVFGGDAYARDVVWDDALGTDLRDRMTDARRFIAILEVVTELAESGRADLDGALRSWSL